MSIISHLPSYEIKFTLALQYDNVDQIENHQTLSKHTAAARSLDSPNGCREQYVLSNTSLA